MILETELCIELFQRHQKAVALTAVGRVFLLDAKLILQASEAAVKNAVLWTPSVAISTGSILAVAFRPSDGISV
jgi:DNA-binding transcriptional LysR family regulator